MCSNDYFQLAFDKSPLPSLILRKDDEGKLIIREVNNSYLQLVGKQQADIKGHFFSALIEDSLFNFQSPKAVEEAAEKSFNTDSPYRMIQRVKKGDSGEEQFWHIETLRLPGGSTGSCNVLQTVTDVTKSIVAGEIHQNAPGGVFYTHPDAVFSVDVNGNFLRANANLLKLAECDEDEILGKSFLPFISPEEQERALSLFGIAVRGEVISFEVSAVTVRGNKKHLEVTNVPIIINGEVAGVYVIAKDATSEYMIRQQLADEQKKKEETLQRMHRTLDSITNGFISLDRNWTVTYWNKAAEEMFGIKRESLVGKNLWEEFLPDNHLNFYSAYQKALYENVVVRFSTYSACFNKHLDVSIYPSEEGLSVYFQDNTEKVEIEKKVKESAEKYDVISRATSDAIWDWDFSTNLITWNKGLKGIFGHSCFVTPTDWWYTHIHPDEVSEVRESISDHIGKKMKLWQREYRFKCGDGSYRHIFDRGFLMLNDQGEAVRMIGSMQDISRIKEKEKELEESLLLYKLVSDATTDAIYEWDLGKNSIRWNASIGPLFGYDASEDSSTERWWVDKMHPRDFKKVNEQLSEGIARRQTKLKREYRFRCSDGRYKYIKDRCTLVYHENQLVKIVGAIRDIDDLRRATEENERLVDLINKVNSLIVISDPQMKISWVNEAFVAHSGYSREDAYGKTPMELLHGEETDADTIARLEAEINKGQSFSGEIVNYTKGGKKYWIQLNCTPVHNEEGFQGFISIANEITERKEREERLRKQTAALRHIAWLSSHEIRKPAANILGILNLFKNADIECEMNEYVGLLEKAAVELDTVVREITQEINTTELE